MKSFTTAVLLAASATVASAQDVIFNPNGTFTCPIPNGVYCAGNSLNTNIIIRCTGTVGQPGNCNDNLSGQFPRGVNFAPCYEPVKNAGRASCSKNCIVYGGSGNINGTFTLPNCVPSTTESTSATTLHPTSSVSATTSKPGVTYTTITYEFTTVTVPCPTVTPTISLSTGPPIISGTPSPSGNGTQPTKPPGGPSGSATATPKPPTTSPSPPAQFTGAAVMNSAGSLLGAAGFIAAYLL